MGKTITTSILPNMQFDDVALATKLLFAPWAWRKGDNAFVLEKKFEKWLGAKKAFSFTSARGALYAILKSLRLDRGDEIIVQAYTCVAVIEPILAVGLNPVYTDIKESDFNIDPSDIEKKITPKTRAIIVQHTFGSPAELSSLIDLAKKHSLILLEDCAHGMGAEYQGRSVGSFGDATVFSFGRDKVLSSVWGGMAVINNQNLLPAMEELNARNNSPGYFWIFQQLFYPLFFSFIRPTYAFLGRYFLAFLRMMRFISMAVGRNELAGQLPEFAAKKMPNALARIALRQFAKLNEFNEHRREISDYYNKTLKDAFILPQSEDSARPIFLRYTIRMDKAGEIIKRARQENIFLGNWYDNVIAPKGVDLKAIGYDLGSCPKAELAASLSLNLPTHIHISPTDARRVANFLLNATK